MRTGDIFEVANVLKHLTYLSNIKPLSFREQRMLERSQYLVDFGVGRQFAGSRNAISNRESNKLSIARASKHDRHPARASSRRRGWSLNSIQLL